LQLPRPAPTIQRRAAARDDMALLAAAAAAAMVAGTAGGREKQVYKPPPMGWSSWNHFGMRVSAPLILDMADAFTARGLRQAGYRYM
jgi:alpha-galactosidase